MLKMSAIAALLLTFAGASPAQQLLFAGQVQKLTLQPSGVGSCPAACPASTGPDANGVQHVCISNDGGCQAAEIKVMTDYLGTSTAATHTFTSRIGEWGRLSMPNSPQPILIHAVDGKAAWAPLDTHDGKTWVTVAAMARVGKLALTSLEQNADGQVPLERVVDSVRGAK